jgi:SAM-dependent methyltransferase
MDVREHNRRAWDRMVERRNRWTLPVDAEEVRAARAGRWRVVLTPTRPVPREWFGALAGADVLCLAGGGGQQGPILAAAGARVVVVDSSPRQLEQDRAVAARDGLDLRTVEGDMADLRDLADGAFDLVFHPAANAFVPSVRPVWAEAYRVLRAGGVLLAGFCNPVRYLVERDPEEASERLIVRHAIPYSDREALSPDELRRLETEGEPLEFGHTLEDQIAGQLEAGFVLTGLYEDRLPAEEDPLSRFIASFVATRARKPQDAPARRG